MPPIEQDVVAEVERAAHADARVAACVTREQVVMEGAVLAPPGATEGVVVEVQGLTRDRPLDGEVFYRQFLVRTAGLLLHVPVERQVLVEAPTGGDVVDDDVPDRVAAQRVVASLQVPA